MAMERADENCKLRLRANRSMPPSVVIPVLAYPDVREAVEWLCRCFGFRERLRIGEHRSQLAIGEGEAEGAVVVAGGDGAAPASVMVRVADLRTHHRNAAACGARILGQPADFPYGELQYTAEDLAGHRWTFSQTLADVDPATWGGTFTEDGSR